MSQKYIIKVENSYVQSAIERIKRIIVPATPEFFPEYTDHAVDHFECTLQTAHALIAEKAKDLMTEDDRSILSLADG
ncbi:hypothetical protein [Candidatus Magnetaquicoccus inordinatus]|uniref:hypothetical protein n=1 Tax=Candidatus Magnetaquicoccus inordinatus TaxID=2496818 RepID=UPI00102CDFA9|nr:hypothetical protein [Candidatus Magnetaquicoccus inordinatus]